jgi:hypothetical protein
MPILTRVDSPAIIMTIVVTIFIINGLIYDFQLLLYTAGIVKLLSPDSDQNT